MKPSDRRAFATFWRDARKEFRGQATIGKENVMIAFTTLEAYELDEIKAAMHSHLRSSDYWPTFRELVRHIEGRIPANEVLYTLVLDGDTALGRILRQHTGDLASLSQRDAIQRVTGYRHKAEEFHQRVLTGDYTERELTILRNARINPFAPIGPGVSGPRAPFRHKVQVMLAGLPEALPAPTRESLDDLTEEQRAANRAKGRAVLSRLMATLGARPKPPPAAQGAGSTHQPEEIAHE